MRISPHPGRHAWAGIFRGMSGPWVDGDLLVFYVGMEGWQHVAEPALDLAGMFRVKLAGFAPSFSQAQLQREFRHNYHVRHKAIHAEQREHLLLVKGGEGSRLFRKACLIGRKVWRKRGGPWQLITPTMAEIFGKFGGIGSLQRSTPRRVEPHLVAKAEKFLESLE